jgi:hypothetical protein
MKAGFSGEIYQQSGDFNQQKKGASGSNADQLRIH